MRPQGRLRRPRVGVVATGLACLCSSLSAVCFCRGFFFSTPPSSGEMPGVPQVPPGSGHIHGLHCCSLGGWEGERWFGWWGDQKREIESQELKTEPGGGLSKGPQPTLCIPAPRGSMWSGCPCQPFSATPWVCGASCAALSSLQRPGSVELAVLLYLLCNSPGSVLLYLGRMARTSSPIHFFVITLKTSCCFCSFFFLLSQSSLLC